VLAVGQIWRNQDRFSRSGKSPVRQGRSACICASGTRRSPAERGEQGIRAFIMGFSDFLSSPDWQADTASTARAILAEPCGRFREVPAGRRRFSTVHGPIAAGGRPTAAQLPLRSAPESHAAAD
jgi:hypothetical protein